MKQIELKVEKAYVMTEVKRNSAYIATRKPEGVQGYDRISATDYEADLFERYFREAESMVTSLLRERLHTSADMTISSDATTTDFDCTLSVPNNFDNNLVGAMNNELASIFVLQVLSLWLNDVDRDSVKSTSEQIQGHLAAFSSMYYNRLRPSRYV